MSKYGNKKEKCDGYTFDSKMEAAYYRHLKLLKRAGEVIDIELQPKFQLQPGFKKNNKTYKPINYKADFLVTYSDGQQAAIDVKGVETNVFKLKEKLFANKYEIPLHVITEYNGRWVDLKQKGSTNLRGNKRSKIRGATRSKRHRGNQLYGTKAQKSITRRQGGGPSVRIQAAQKRNKADNG